MANDAIPIEWIRHYATTTARNYTGWKILPEEMINLLLIEWANEKGNYYNSDGEVIWKPTDKHGKWYRPYGTPRCSYKFFCSVCGGIAYQVTGINGRKDKSEAPKCTYDFCPNCGARMDGDGKTTSEEALENAYQHGWTDAESHYYKYAQRWIPVTERLPDRHQETSKDLPKSDVVIATVKYTESPFEYAVDKAFMIGDGWYLADDYYGFYIACEVVAWMPLPELYREDSEKA